MNWHLLPPLCDSEGPWVSLHTSPQLHSRARVAHLPHRTSEHGGKARR